MTLLIVDDNRYVVEGLKGQLPYQQMGIDMVLGCYSVAESKKLFLEYPIDLLITDIEMPGEDGFALLEWLRGQSLTPITVLLTSYAEFGYAQRSVEYGVSSYLLKPLDNEALRKALEQMIEKYRKQNQDLRRMNLGDKWLNQQRKTRTEFWQRLLKAIHGKSVPTVQVLLSGKPASLEPGGRYVPVCMEISCGETAWSPELICYACENVLMELSQGMGLSYQTLYRVDDVHFVLMLQLPEQTEPEQTQKLMELFSDFFRNQLDMKVHYVIRGCCTLEQIPDMLGVSLPETRGQNGPAEPLQSFRFRKPDMDSWKRMILSGDLDGLRESVSQYLKKEYNPEYGMVDFLGAFQIDWNLMITGILKENGGLSILELRQGGFSQWLTADPEQLTELVMEDASHITELLDIDSFNSMSAAKIRSYIQEHLADVTRSSIAEHFHFSPNYLSRLFRNVEGISLINYIQNQRMERAKELLANTNQSISEIAMEIGYPNFSHFSKRFRNFIGCSPNEYRRKARAASKKGSTK